MTEIATYTQEQRFPDFFLQKNVRRLMPSTEKPASPIPLSFTPEDEEKLQDSGYIVFTRDPTIDVTPALYSQFALKPRDFKMPRGRGLSFSHKVELARDFGQARTMKLRSESPHYFLEGKIGTDDDFLQIARAPDVIKLLLECEPTDYLRFVTSSWNTRPDSPFRYRGLVTISADGIVHSRMNEYFAPHFDAGFIIVPERL